jgi:hypothetical protein
VKRLDHWRTLLKAAKAELPMRRRAFNATQRSLRKLEEKIEKLEQKIEHNLANS